MKRDALRITVRDVDRRIAEIREVARDYEKAHGMEDQLFRDILKAVSDGHPRSRGLARAALKCSEIEFPRVTS